MNAVLLAWEIRLSKNRAYIQYVSYSDECRFARSGDQVGRFDARRRRRAGGGAPPSPPCCVEFPAIRSRPRFRASRRRARRPPPPRPSAGRALPPPHTHARAASRRAAPRSPGVRRGPRVGKRAPRRAAPAVGGGHEHGARGKTWEDGRAQAPRTS